MSISVKYMLNNIVLNLVSCYPYILCLYDKIELDRDISLFHIGSSSSQAKARRACAQIFFTAKLIIDRRSNFFLPNLQSIASILLAKWWKVKIFLLFFLFVFVLSLCIKGCEIKIGYF